MASTRKLSDTMNFVQPFVNWAQLAIGTSDEPFVTSANLAAQTIVGPPCAWPWNRAEATLQTTQGAQDYTIALPDYAFLESASIQMVGNITFAEVVDGVATFDAVNKFSSLLTNGSVKTVIRGCATSALNGPQTIFAATPTTFSCNIATGDLAESETGAIVLAGPIMQLEVKELVITEAVEQDRPSFICEFISDDAAASPPALTLSKTHTGDFAQGGTGTFTVTVTNTGTSPTSGLVTVTENPPAALTLVSITGTGWSIDGNVATRSDALGVGASYPPLTVTVTVSDSATTPQLNNISASGGGMQPPGTIVTTTDTVTIDSAPSLPDILWQAYSETCFLAGGTTINTINLGAPHSGTTNRGISAGDIGFVSLQLTATQPATFGTITDDLGDGNVYSAITAPLTVPVGSETGYLAAYQVVFNQDVPSGTTFHLTTTLTTAGTLGGRWALFIIHGVSGLSQVVKEASAGPVLSLDVPITTTERDVVFGTFIDSLDTGFDVPKTVLTITGTQLSGGIATYTYTLVSGPAPQPGQQVYVENSTNGSHIFNTGSTGFAITSVGTNQFSIAIPSTDVPFASDTGTAYVYLFGLWDANTGSAWSSAFIDPSSYTSVTPTQLAITSSASVAPVAGFAATYGFTVISGPAPQVGQVVTVAGTTNGGGVLDRTNGVIKAVTSNTFTLNLWPSLAGSFPFQAENATATVYGQSDTAPAGSHLFTWRVPRGSVTPQNMGVILAAYAVD